MVPPSFILSGNAGQSGDDGVSYQPLGATVCSWVQSSSQHCGEISSVSHVSPSLGCLLLLFVVLVVAVIVVGLGSQKRRMFVCRLSFKREITRNRIAREFPLYVCRSMHVVHFLLDKSCGRKRFVPLC